MHIYVTNDEGSGSLATESVYDFSYSEDVTSLEPSRITGGSGQITLSAPANEFNKVGNTHPNSLLLINNKMSLRSDDFGDVQFQVKRVSVNDGLAQITGDTLESRLNVERTAQAYGGASSTLLGAIQYYCGLVDIFPTIDGELETELLAIPVNFIGWVGNVWEHLKMLCAGVSISETDNVGLEAYINNDELVFRKAKVEPMSLATKFETQTVNVDAFEAAVQVNVFNYNTYYGVNQIVRDTSNAPEQLGYIPQNVSIADSMQVDPGETVTKRFNVNASLVQVNQPVCVDTINPFPYTGIGGQYVIVGSDGLPVMPSQWIGLGGSLTVSLTENPNEIEITIVAPPVVQIDHAEGDGSGIAPYKIGVESSGDQDYPAFYITGSGVFFDKRETTVLTGASEEYTSKLSAPQIDNPFITNAKDWSMRGIAAAQAICGPTVALTENVANVLRFGETPGRMRTVGSNKYRINQVSYAADGVVLNGETCTSFADFNAIWTGKTFANFKSIALDPALYPTESLKFNEFTVIPLMESA